MADPTDDLDDPPVPVAGTVRRVLVRDGFPGQRLRALPRPLVTAALRDRVTRRLLVTDAGYFPHAAAHGRVRHAGAAESVLIVCTAGAGRVAADSGTHRVEAGQAVVLPAGSPHRYEADRDDPWSIWWMHVAGEDTDDLIAAINAGESPVLTLHDTDAAVEDLQRVVTALECDDTAASLYLAGGAAWSLLARLAAERRAGAAPDADRIRAVQDVIRADLAARMTVAGLARQAGLSASHFAVLFKRATGSSVMDYVKRQRSARARELLLTTSLTVAEVAERVGYADPFYFARHFRSVNGTSPSAFRARARLDDPR